jgi:hypothetical protein
MGIDPGVKGGIALIDEKGEVFSTISLDGLTEGELAQLFGQSVAHRWMPKPICIIEKVGYIKGDGAMGSFTFGKVYGLLRGLALGHGLIIHDAYPMMWQSSLCCLSSGNKNVTKNKAIELFPKYHQTRPRGITHGIADALLIAEWGRRVALRNPRT